MNDLATISELFRYGDDTLLKQFFPPRKKTRRRHGNW